MERPRDRQARQRQDKAGARAEERTQGQREGLDVSSKAGKPMKGKRKRARERASRGGVGSRVEGGRVSQ